MSYASLADPDLRELAGHVERYRTDPIAFFREILGVRDIWDGMEEIAASVRDNRRTAVAGCHDSSKTLTAAALTLWWVTIMQPAKALLMGPKEEQLKKTLFGDIIRLYNGSKIPLGGRMLTLEWQFDPETYILGMTAKKDTGDDGQSATGMQGHKSPRLLLIFDEATGIERPFWISGRGIQGKEGCRWLALANPTNPNCGFSDCWRQASWNCININAFDTPNLKAGPGSNPYTPSAEWVDEMREDFGEGSPTWISRVLGRFPDTAIDTLIGIVDLERSYGRKVTETPAHARPPVYLGVDVARQGDDFSAVAVVREEQLAHLEWFQIADGPAVAGVVKEIAQSFGLVKDQAANIAMDIGGLGVGPFDTLRREGWHVTPVDFGSSPVDEDRFFDRRTEIWYEIRTWLKNTAELSDLEPREKKKLEADLCGCKVDHGALRGKKTVMKLEAKKDMKKRLGHSPDIGDALALALSNRSARKGLLSPGMWRQRPEQIDNPRIAHGEPQSRRKGRDPAFAGGGDEFYD